MNDHLGISLSDPPLHTNDGAESIETVIIGGGQAGLAVGYELAKHDRPFVILDAHERVGDAWRKRWDSLRLFTPARFDGLPGMRFPARRDAFITKDEMADYLETYAATFELPVRTGMRVHRLSRRGDGFVISAGDSTFVAQNVIVAMANFQQPRVPPFATELAPTIVQLHSHEYRNPSQLQDGSVLVVGAGNSGAEIAVEVVKTHPTWISGQETGHIPFRLERWFGRQFGVSVVRFLGYHVLTVRTPIGRKARPFFLTHAAPLVRVKPKDLVTAGITRIGRMAGVQDGLPVTEDGEVLEVANVVWCTGYVPGFSWIDLPLLGDRQEPNHSRGVVADQPGLYFVGLEFLYAATSPTITGVPRDARHIVHHLVSRSRSIERLPAGATP